MKQNEYTAQFATWAVLASPIVFSADMRSLQQTQTACLVRFSPSLCLLTRELF